MRCHRVDNFWFTLMHELVHLSLCLEGEGKAAFIDDLDLRESSRMEKEADDMAEDALILAALWESSAVRVKAAPMAVYELS